MTENRPNRLAKETSTYLKGAAHQPVDWYPWGEEAFRRAKELDRPILLDIGATWCHWCHVIDRESYEDPELAKFINDHFVAVKGERGDAEGKRGLPSRPIRPRERRHLGAAEVPPSRDDGVGHGPLPPHAGGGPADHRHAHPDLHGPRGRLRPNRRRVPSVLDGPAVDRPAFREDALRQRGTPRELRSCVAAHEGPDLPRHSGGNPGLGRGGPLGSHLGRVLREPRRGRRPR